MSNLICPYCGAKAKLVDQLVVYHRRYGRKKDKMWVCGNYPDCDAYVGCHPGTEIPLGRLADQKLRNFKQEAHRQFDPLWKCGLMTRAEAYEWLAVMLYISREECHIGKFNVGQCKRVIEICKKQDNEQICQYRLEHYGYKLESEKPVFDRGYQHSRNQRKRGRK